MEVITTHINAEFDSFASMVAARRFYPDAVMVFPGAQERNLRLFLENFPHQYRFRRLRSIQAERIDRLILVDTRRADRIGRLSEIVGRPGLEVHVYDHHPPSPQDVRGAVEVIEEVGAATTVMVEELQKRRMRITPAEATIFGMGIYEDTGSLSFTSTTPRDIRAAAYLLECGLDLRVVSDYISRELTPDQVSLLNDLLKNTEFVEAGGIRMAVATGERERFVGDLAVLGHKLKDIENLNALFILVKMHDRVHLVARSRLEGVDAGEIAAALGGGGHPTAASAVIRRQDLGKVKEKLIRVIREKVKPVFLARNLMSATLKSLPAGATVAEAYETMARFGIDHLPVLEDGGLSGIIHREAVERAVRHGLGGSPVADFMSTDYEVLAPDDPYWRIQELFLDHGQHFLPVLEGGKLVGAVTRSDLLGVIREEASRKPSWRSDRPEGGAAFRPSRNLAGLMEARLPRPVSDLIGRLGETAGELGVSAYLVGGFVRDLLLGRPNLDLDVVVEGDGIRFAREVVKRLGGRARTHKKFETAIIILPNVRENEGGFKVDVATARMEYYERPGALPKVEHGPIKMDLYRRDFTINALAIQIGGPDFGRLIDYFGGQRDLEEGVIRVLHGLSFVDDPTRIFRAVRFEQRLNFSMAEQTLKLVGNALRSNLIETIAGPRLLNELEEILKEEKPSTALLRLRELGLLRTVHPALAAAPLDLPLLERLMRTVAERGEIAGKNPQAWVIYLAALVRQFTLEEMNLLAARLGMPPGTSRLLMDIYVGHRRLATLLGQPGLKPSMVYRAAAGHPPETILFTLGCYPGTVIHDRLLAYLPQRGRIKPLLSGRDLKKMGYPVGPLYRRILDDLLDAQLNGEVLDRRRASAYVRAAFPPGKMGTGLISSKTEKSSRKGGKQS